MRPSTYGATWSHQVMGPHAPIHLRGHMEPSGDGATWGHQVMGPHAPIHLRGHMGPSGDGASAPLLTPVLALCWVNQGPFSSRAAIVLHTWSAGHVCSRCCSAQATTGGDVSTLLACARSTVAFVKGRMWWNTACVPQCGPYISYRS
jgi:hypothetical protein